MWAGKAEEEAEMNKAAKAEEERCWKKQKRNGHGEHRLILGQALVHCRPSKLCKRQARRRSSALSTRSNSLIGCVLGTAEPEPRPLLLSPVLPVLWARNRRQCSGPPLPGQPEFCAPPLHPEPLPTMPVSKPPPPSSGQPRAPGQHQRLLLPGQHRNSDQHQDSDQLQVSGKQQDQNRRSRRARTDPNLNLAPRGMVQARRRRFRPLLLSAALLQLGCFGMAAQLLVSQLNAGQIFQRFQVVSLMGIVLLQLVTLMLSLYSAVNLMEMAWKGSYGYGDNRVTKLLCFATLLLAGLLAGLAALLWFQSRPNFFYHGIFLGIMAITALIGSIVFFRRFRSVNNFVADALHANGVNCIPLTEQNARDLFQLQECETEMRTYINSTAWLGFRRHVRSFRHAEFYALQKWVAQLERIAALDDGKEAIGCLIKEMQERCRVFRIGEDDQFRYRQLAVMPLIFVPVDQCSTLEANEEEEC